ncbi:MAG: DUF6883 domain-containing protein [Vicinamibacterales bacterium]
MPIGISAYAARPRAASRVSTSQTSRAPFTIRAILKGPNGESALVVSVWFVPHDRGVPRFVTAYPGGAR